MLYEYIDEALTPFWSVRQSGMVIDTAGALSSISLMSNGVEIKHALVRTCLDIFKSILTLCPHDFVAHMPPVNFVIVVGPEKLFIEMQRLLNTLNSHAQIIKINKSAGVCRVPSPITAKCLYYSGC